MQGSRNEGRLGGGFKKYRRVRNEGWRRVKKRRRVRGGVYIGMLKRPLSCRILPRFMYFSTAISLLPAVHAYRINQFNGSQNTSSNRIKFYSCKSKRLLSDFRQSSCHNNCDL